MKGYFNDFEQTSLHIRRGWYDTGDMGNLDKDGYLWHVGRLKRFVKIGGEMVSLVKIESVLDQLIPEDAQYPKNWPTNYPKSPFQKHFSSWRNYRKWAQEKSIFGRSQR